MESINYFRINLTSSNGLISIHEQKSLLPNEYHFYSKNDTNQYTILVETEKTVGKGIYYMDVHPETYETYEFKDIKYQIINDYNIDGFEYDREREVVFYGYIYGIYATQNEDKYYDIVTGEEIPYEIISNIHEIVSIDDYSEMIEDLTFIKEHKNVYISITEERFSKLLKGAINRKIAFERYKQNYAVKKKAYDKKVIKKQKQWQQIKEKLKDESYPKREEIKKLIYEIRNS